MEVQIESPGALLRQMKVSIPAERVAQALDQRLKNIAGRAKVPGFRPGKAPFKVIQQQYGESARMEVVSDLVRGTYGEALAKAGVNPAGAPQLEVTAEKPGEPLEYVARFEVYPEVKLNDVAALQVEKPIVVVSEADQEKLIQNLRRNSRKLTPVTRPAAEGDVCKVDFEGRLDGEAFPGGKGDDVTLEIGQGQFLPGLERGVIGHAAGERFEADVEFPADYRNESLRGKTARFSVNLKEVQEASMPEVDDEFLKTHGVPEGAGYAGLQLKIRGALEAERDKAIRNRMKNQALDQLLTANPIEVPAALVAQETERMREEAAARFGRQLKPEQKLQLFPDEVLAAGARKRVALGLLVGEVIKSNELKLDEARVERALNEIASEYEQAEQVKQLYRGRPDLMQGLRALALEEQVVELLLRRARQQDVIMSLDQLLNPRQPASA
jgi:trigger factor